MTLLTYGDPAFIGYRLAGYRLTKGDRQALGRVLPCFLHFMQFITVPRPHSSLGYRPPQKDGRQKGKRGMEKWKAYRASHFPTPPTATR